MHPTTDSITGVPYISDRITPPTPPTTVINIKYIITDSNLIAGLHI